MCCSSSWLSSSSSRSKRETPLMLFAFDSYRPGAAPADLLHHTFVVHIKDSMYDDPNAGQ